MGNPPTAKLLTLFCSQCGTGSVAGKDIPLVAVLRDTLGETDRGSHRLTAVWLLTYSHPTIAQRSLAAIPFFYWSPSDGSARVRSSDSKPLLDLSSPQHPAVANVERQILQWTALDTIGTPVRATSREYRTNEVDHERLHLEEANSYLLQAPVGDDPDELSEEERDFVTARLELRKKLLGGFVDSSKVVSLGKAASFAEEATRTRNWELLRQCAEKAGLIFDPVKLASEPEENYAMLWYPEHGKLEPQAGDLGAIWKLLGIRNPYTDDRLINWKGLTRDGKVGRDPVQGVKLIPLGLYSLSYPRQPLLLVDFRDKTSLRRKDLTQKSIDEITSGVVGLSHFTNWYYFVASDAFSFVQERRGKANNRAERLDSYSQFRVSLALDHGLDPALQKELQRRSGSLSSNPLETAPANEMAAALKRYSMLSVEAAGDSSRLEKRMKNERREELATVYAGPTREGADLVLHALTFGGYTHRAKSDEVYMLAAYRRANYNLAFLDHLVAAGTPPEVPYQPERVRAAISELSGLLHDINSSQMRDHARLTLEALRKISSDDTLRAACDTGLKRLLDDRPVSPDTVPGIVAAPITHEFK